MIYLHIASCALHVFCRHAGHSLAGAITKADGGSNFQILTGIGDSSSFHNFPFPTWETPLSDMDKCYFADWGRPAADVAAQVAAALALVARVLHEHSTDHDPKMLESVLDHFTRKALWAYEYAADTFLEHGLNATCAASAARSHCIGECHGEDVKSVRNLLAGSSHGSVFDALLCATQLASLRSSWPTKLSLGLL